MITQTDKNYSSITHLSSFAGWVFPFGNVIVPFILWSAKKNESTYIDIHGKAAVNFQLSLILYGFLLALFIIPITIFTLGLGLIALLIGIVPLLILIIISIISASIKATHGEYYHYPFTIEFIK
ncbi:MAG: DUF4870 domain-containing protein [Lutibacter sp.]|jgi:hypothetical protein